MTTDWTAQTQAGIDRWLEAQRAWWTQVLGPGGDAPRAGTLSADAAREAIEMWRTSAYRVVDAQAQALLGAIGDRPETDVQGLVRRWTDAQREMWQGWLAMAEGVAPKEQEQKASPNLEQAGRQMIESLREAAEHLVRSQAEWAKTWSEAATRGAAGTPPPHDGAERGTGGPEAAQGGP
jgi:hypothetical protein